MAPPCTYCGAKTHSTVRCFERLQKESPEGECPRCHDTGHHWRNCTKVKKPVTCNFCKVVGHSQKECDHLANMLNNRQAAGAKHRRSQTDLNNNNNNTCNDQQTDAGDNKDRMSARQSFPFGATSQATGSAAVPSTDGQATVKIEASFSKTNSGPTTPSSTGAIPRQPPPSHNQAFRSQHASDEDATESIAHQTSFSFEPSTGRFTVQGGSLSDIQQMLSMLSANSPSTPAEQGPDREMPFSTPKFDSRANPRCSFSTGGQAYGTDAHDQTPQQTFFHQTQRDLRQQQVVGGGSNFAQAQGNTYPAPQALRSQDAFVGGNEYSQTQVGGILPPPFQRNGQSSPTQMQKPSALTQTAFKAAFPQPQGAMPYNYGGGQPYGSGAGGWIRPLDGAPGRFNASGHQQSQPPGGFGAAAPAWWGAAQQNATGQHAAAAVRDTVQILMSLFLAQASALSSLSASTPSAPPTTPAAVQPTQPQRRPFVEDEFPLTEANYMERLQLYDNDVWPTFGAFECPACGTAVDSFQGIVLKACQVHRSCRACLKTHILESPFKEVGCLQFGDCGAFVSDDEISALLSSDELTTFNGKPTRQQAENDTTSLQLFVMDNDLAPNVEAFECPVCLDEVPAMEGIVSKNCGAHFFCKECMREQIRNSDIALVKCPAVDCDANLQDREILLLVTEDEYLALHQKGLRHATAQAMQCMVPDCQGLWYVANEGNGRFDCPLCQELNCSKCKVVHENRQTCAEYQADEATRRNNERSEEETKAYLESRLRDGHAMICPKCKAVVEKVDGCDGMLCTVCRTELCWATKGLRWGPGGKGDWEGGGCRCMVGGKRCAPNCQNCH